MEKNQVTTTGSRRLRKKRVQPVKRRRGWEWKKSLRHWLRPVMQCRTERRCPKPNWRRKSAKPRSWNSRRRKRKPRRCWKRKLSARELSTLARKCVLRRRKRCCCSGHSAAARIETIVGQIAAAGGAGGGVLRVVKIR